MKNKLINIIDGYIKTKHSNDFNLLLTINNYLKLDKTTITKVDYVDDCIRISLLSMDNILSIVFYDNGDLGITLPYSGLFIVKSDNSNSMSYSEIKTYLQSEYLLINKVETL